MDTGAGSASLSTLARPDSTKSMSDVLHQLTSLVREHAAEWSSEYDVRITSDERRSRMSAFIGRVLDGEHIAETDLPLVAELLYYTGSQRQAAALGLVLPLYNTFEDYDVNTIQPWTIPPQERPVVPGKRWSLLGHEIDFPIGVPASALTGNAEWIGLLAGAGYNVLTFKTVRTREWAPHPAPNWVFVTDNSDAFEVGTVTTARTVIGSTDGWSPTESVGGNTANSFGVPSPGPRQWMAQVAAALDRLSSGQMLIVSVMGYDYEGTGDPDVLAADYRDAALLAAEAGAPVIELNLSCPNSLSDDIVAAPLCEDPALVRRIVGKVRRDLPQNVKLVVKLSYLRFEALESLVNSLGASVDGYAGINTVQCEVRTLDGGHAFPGRNLAGVSGKIIHDLALDFVTSLARIRSIGQHTFDILGMGGVTSPAAFENMYNAGASVVQSASGVFLDLFLSQKCIDAFGASLPAVPPVVDDVVLSNLTSTIRKVLDRSGGRLDIFALSSALPVPAMQVRDVLNYMNREKIVEAHTTNAGVVRYILNA